MRKLIVSVVVVCCVFSCAVVYGMSDTFIKTVAYESSSEPLNGQVYVAHTILNRAMAWRKTPDEVCLQPNQFSCWYRGKPTQRRTLTERELFNAKEAIKLAEEMERDNVLYYKVSTSPSSWFSRSVKEGKLRTYVLIGKHQFYKEVAR